MSKIAITHALVHVRGKGGVSVGHSFRLGDMPYGRYVTALEYELLPCGGVRLIQYSEPAEAGEGTCPHDELKHFVYPANIMTGAASFIIEA